MQIKEITDFIDWTLDKGRYPQTGKWTIKERAFAQGLKISEEVGELNEQLLGKFQGQRIAKKDNISDEKFEKEIADVILATVRLARLLDLDVEKILKEKMEILEKRFGE